MFFKSPELVGIAIDDNCIEFGYFKKLRNNAFKLINYKIQNLYKLEIYDSIIFNPTLLYSYIQFFFEENKINKTNVYLYLSKSKKIKDFIITSPNLDNNREDLKIEEDGAFIWQINYLGFEDNLNYYYVTGIAQEILFQYKTLCFQLPCTLKTITTKNLAIINAKKNLAINYSNLKDLTPENLHHYLYVSSKDKFILPHSHEVNENFLSSCFGMFI